MLTLALGMLISAAASGVALSVTTDSRLDMVIHMSCAALNALAAYGVWGAL